MTNFNKPLEHCSLVLNNKIQALQNPLLNPIQYEDRRRDAEAKYALFMNVMIGINYVSPVRMN